MLKLAQQVGAITSSFEKHGTILVLEHGRKYLLIGWDLFSDLIIKPMAFSFAKLCEEEQQKEKSAEQVKTFNETKKSLKTTIDNFKIKGEEIELKDFTQYSFDKDITYIKGMDHWVFTTDLLEIQKLTKWMTVTYHMYNNLLVVLNSDDEIIMIEWTQPITQKSLFDWVENQDSEDEE